MFRISSASMTYSCRAGNSGQLTFNFDLADGERVASVLGIRTMSEYITLGQFWPNGLSTVNAWIRNDTETNVGSRSATCTALIMRYE